MPRNLYNRVELVIPIEDERLRSELLDVLDRSLADNTNAWDLREDGAWERREAGDEKHSVQSEMVERHKARASETAH